MTDTMPNRTQQRVATLKSVRACRPGFSPKQKKGVQLHSDVADTLHEVGVCLPLAETSGVAQQETLASTWRIS